MEELCGVIVSSKDTERISEAIGHEIENGNKRDMESALWCQRHYRFALRRFIGPFLSFL
jgi:hypothetical protein